MLNEANDEYERLETELNDKNNKVEELFEEIDEKVCLKTSHIFEV